MSFNIEVVHARQVLDSRGNPTDRGRGRFSKTGAIGRGPSCPPAPAPASNEAVELRDGDEPDVYLGKGVQQAVDNVNEIIAPVRGGAWSTRREQRV